MSEKPPKQDEMFKPGDVERLKRGRSLFKSTIKSLEEADLKRKEDKARAEREKAIDEVLRPPAK